MQEQLYSVNCCIQLYSLRKIDHLSINYREILERMVTQVKGEILVIAVYLVLLVYQACRDRRDLLDLRAVWAEEVIRGLRVQVE